MKQCTQAKKNGAQMTDDPKTQILTLIGEIAVRFSNLEFQMSAILSKLIDTSAGAIVGGFLSDEFSLSKTTELIRKLSRYRFVHRNNMIAKVHGLCEQVDKIRVKRNFFVHGMWVFDREILCQGKITVLKMTWKEDRKTKSWSRAKETIFTVSDLKQMGDTITRLFDQALSIANDLKSEDMMPHSQQGKSTKQKD